MWGGGVTFPTKDLALSSPTDKNAIVTDQFLNTKTLQLARRYEDRESWNDCLSFGGHRTKLAAAQIRLQVMLIGKTRYQPKTKSRDKT